MCDKWLLHNISYLNFIYWSFSCTYTYGYLSAVINDRIRSRNYLLRTQVVFICRLVFSFINIFSDTNRVYLFWFLYWYISVMCIQIYLTLYLFVVYILLWYTKYLLFFHWLARSLSVSVSFYLRACSYREYRAKKRSKVNCCFSVELQGYMPPFSERKNLWYANTIFISPSHLYQRSRTARNQRVPILPVRRS